MRTIICKIYFAVMLLGALGASAQRSYYTLFQVGGQFGVQNPGYEGSFNGYAAHFVFGLNFNERAYIGLGAGNETFRGAYRTDEQVRGRAQTQAQYDTYLVPVFVDARVPVAYVGEYSWIGVLGNAGYAPRIGPVYDRGALFRGGLFYVYETMRGQNFSISAVYGYQELNRNAIDLGRPFRHQHVGISVGMLFK